MTSIQPDNLPGAHDAPPDVVRAIARISSRAGVLASRIHWFDSTDSTNDVAAHLAESGAEEGTMVVAEMQTAGRGRHGRRWFSPPGAGLYASIVLRPASAVLEGASTTALLTLASGVAIAEAVRVSTGLPARIKWPNDVLVGGRKIAGILAESAVQGAGVQFVVLGFGVNLREASYPSEIAPRVTSIEAETTQPPDLALILAEIVAMIGERYADLRAGKFDAILGAWRSLALLSGAPIEWDSPAGAVRGFAEDIDRDGALLARIDGRLERIVAGEVRWLLRAES